MQPLFEVLEKLQEYLFAAMEDKIKKGEIVCRDRRTGHLPKEGAVIVKSVKIVPPIQTHIRTGPEAGAPMQNPMARLQLSFPSPVRERAATEFYDRTALTKRRNGSYVYKPKTVDGKPVTAANLHKVLTSGTLGSGVLDVSSVVCSTFGISLSRWVLFLMLDPPPARKPTIHDWIAAMPDQFQQDLEQSKIDNDRSMNLSNGGDSSMDLSDGSDRSMNLSPGNDRSEDLSEIIYVDEDEFELFFSPKK